MRVRPEEVRDPTYLLFYLLEFSLCVPTALFGLSPSFSYTLWGLYLAQKYLLLVYKILCHMP